MTAIKIGERYRYTRRGLYFGLVGDVTSSLGDGFYRFKSTESDGRLTVDGDYLESVVPAEPTTPSFLNGDVVKLTSPDGKITIQGPVRDDVWIGDLAASINIRLRTDLDWSLVVVEHAPKPLPTEPGLYVMKGMVSNPSAVLLRRTDLGWEEITGTEIEPGDPELFARNWQARGVLSRLIEEPTS